MKNVTYINAGAGSGKTTRLTNILTELIKDKKVKPEQVILTTFTTKAANEFKEKAKKVLYEAGLYDEAVQLDHAMIGTVHSVCQRMISKYWFNLGLPSDMGVMAEEDTKYYLSQSLAELPTRSELNLLYAFAKEFGIKKDRSRGIDYTFWKEHLKSIIGYATNYELDDFSLSETESINCVLQFLRSGHTGVFPPAQLQAVLDEHDTFLRGCKPNPTNDARINVLKEARRSLPDLTIDMLCKVRGTIGTPQGYGPEATAFAAQMDNIWNSQFVFDKQEEYIQLIFELAKRWKDKFAQFKLEKNLLDYNDMEKYMRRLMKDPHVAGEIQKSYHYLFVDEFQDSSPIQVKIFDMLSDRMEHSYWVGDYKQSIYGFRGSDISLIKAVVDRVNRGGDDDSCNTDRLDKSYRSLPDIVNVNNKIFEKTFASVLVPEDIQLDPVRNNVDGVKSLRYFRTSKDAGVAEHVLKLLNQGAKPAEIAVLALDNSKLSTVAQKLSERGIPASRGDNSASDTRTYTLVAALLRVVGSQRDSLSKATVAYLTEPDYDTRKIIEEKIQNDAVPGAKLEDYLAQVPLLEQLEKLRPVLQQQSVASMVESMIIELDLYDVAMRVEADSVLAASCLQTLIGTARTYEEHCVQMNQPATIEGFLSYVETVVPKCPGDPQGVQLHTYHSSKGLQWKYVILMSLNDQKLTDTHTIIRQEIYGVQVSHTAAPSVVDPYPAVFIRLMPWVFGAAKNVPVPIWNIINSTGLYQPVLEAAKAERNRIFYVGMTRPQDVLLLAVDKTDPLQWPIDVGASSTAIPPSGDWDAFATRYMFSEFTLTDAELAALAPYGSAGTRNMALNLTAPTSSKPEPRYLSPSKIQGKGTVVLPPKDFGCRIPLSGKPDMAMVGDCIHQIYAGIEEPPTDRRAAIINSYGLKDVLTDIDAIRRAWENLVGYLTATHGAAVKTYHERPFRLERNGQCIVGSIDLVWQTADGDILIDYKTCPAGVTVVSDSENEHYAGRYGGQLDAYRDALAAAGETVLQRYIYYPVSGLLVEIK